MELLERSQDESLCEGVGPGAGALEGWQLLLLLLGAGVIEGWELLLLGCGVVEGWELLLLGAGAVEGWELLLLLGCGAVEGWELLLLGCGAVEGWEELEEKGSAELAEADWAELALALDKLDWLDHMANDLVQGGQNCNPRLACLTPAKNSL